MKKKPFNNDNPHIILIFITLTLILIFIT